METLIEWASLFIDHMNVFKRDLERKEISGNRISCLYKAKGICEYIIQEKLALDILDKIKEGSIALICLNTKNNLEFVISNWQSFAGNPKLKIIFVNLKQNLQWSLIPYIHNRISEPHAIKAGLKTVFQSIPEETG